MLNKMASLGDFNIDYYIHHVSDNMMNGSKCASLVCSAIEL